MRKQDRTEQSEQLGLGFAPSLVSINDVMAPTGYTGLSAFHKYWGKKPIECLGFLVEQLTQPNDLVVDPFVGSGLIARECALRGRRFIGIDINPVSIELARMISDLPNLEQYDSAVQEMKNAVRQSIDESYLLADGKTASHGCPNCTDEKLDVWYAKRKMRNTTELCRPACPTDCSGDCPDSPGPQVLCHECPEGVRRPGWSEANGIDVPDDVVLARNLAVADAIFAELDRQVDANEERKEAGWLQKMRESSQDLAQKEIREAVDDDILQLILKAAAEAPAPTLYESCRYEVWRARGRLSGIMKFLAGRGRELVHVFRWGDG